jgi:GDP-L-fucose synthase
MSNPVVLITGGTGLVGSAIKTEITAHNLEFDNKFIFISSKDYDLSDFATTCTMFETYKPTYVIHLAACVGGLYKNMNNKVDMFEKNLSINFNVVKCAHNYGVKKMVACLSTCIFPDKTEYPIDETMLHNGPPHSSNDAYAYAKRMLEVHCRMYNENHGDNFVCIIPTNIYGPNDNFNIEDGHVLPVLINKCFTAKKRGQAFVVRGTGSPLRQFIYSLDMAQLIISILYNNRVNRESIILSVPEADEVSIKDIATIIAKKFDYQHKMVFDHSFSDGQYKKTADNTKLMSFYPSFKFTPIQEGISKTVDWFIENHASARL